MVPRPATGGKVVVLDLVDTAGLERDELEYVTDVVREQALALRPDRFLVMTRENILALLPAGVDLATCEGRCEVETGRRVGADYVVSGRVLRFDGELRVLLRLHATDSARQLASGRAAADTVGALEPSVELASQRLFNALR